MSRDLASPGSEETTWAAILIRAARCWREARDARRPIQPYLSSALWIHDGPILAPVLDSLIRFFERALGRSMTVGADEATSADEQLLIALLQGSGPSAGFDCSPVSALLLDCSLRSTRVMMTFALPSLAADPSR
jgi:hypothetical protein